MPERAELDLHVGAIATRWAALEATLRKFVAELCIYNEPSLDAEPAFHVWTVLISNTDMRQNSASAKALAHLVQSIPNFYERTTAVLNRIDHEMRTERNRYIHDHWQTWGPFVERLKAGATVRRLPASGKQVMTHGSLKQFFGLSDLKIFADEVEKADQQIHALIKELRGDRPLSRPDPLEGWP